jgi:hypothetical protein
VPCLRPQHLAQQPRMAEAVEKWKTTHSFAKNA